MFFSVKSAFPNKQGVQGGWKNWKNDLFLESRLEKLENNMVFQRVRLEKLEKIF